MSHALQCPIYYKNRIVSESSKELLRLLAITLKTGVMVKASGTPVVQDGDVILRSHAQSSKGTIQQLIHKDTRSVQNESLSTLRFTTIRIHQ